MNDPIEVQQGIFIYTPPKEVNTGQWLEDHLDCDTIADYNGSTIKVYAFTLDPKYNFALKGYRKRNKLDKQQLLKGISSDGLNSLWFSKVPEKSPAKNPPQ